MVLLAAVARLVPDDRERCADVQRVNQMAAGDASGLGTLYDRHARAIYSLALRIVGEQAEAEDVVQEVFAQAWRQAARFDARRGSVIAWLLIMTRTRAIDRLRMRQARPDRNATPDPLFSNSCLRQSRIRLPGWRQKRMRVASAGRSTSCPCFSEWRSSWRSIEGLSQSEIAARLEQPLGTVKTRIRLGLLRLRDVLSGAAT